MDVFKVISDAKYKNLTGETEAVIGRFHPYKGQSLISEWVVPRFAKVEDVSEVKTEVKAEKAKEDDFDARCYGSILLVKQDLQNLFTGIPSELLPVEILNDSTPFLYVNLTDVVKAINFDGQDYKKSMELIRSNKIDFNAGEIGQRTLFRDEKLTGFYYCTNDFILRFKQAGIKGLEFEKAGQTNA